MATGVEVASSSHIEEMIQELVQPEGFEVPVTETLREGITTMTGEPSSRSSLPEDLPSLDPQLCKITRMSHILPFSLSLLTLLL